MGTLRSRCGAVAAALLLVACGAGTVEAPDLPGSVRLSFFAVGDTGAVPSSFVRSHDTQMRVARALEAEHRRRPVDAFVLLGDNFYPDGLAAKELPERVRENVVRPYCHFLALDGPAWDEVADACEPERRGDRPIPIYAVLGNHDHTLPESPPLQREAVPRFIPNWRVPFGAVEVIELADSELASSVSLILYDPRVLADEGDSASLERALRDARGPWRILAGHYPISDAHPGSWVRKALDAIDVPVHLHLAGHEHNLQIGAKTGGDPALQVVAGTGSGERSVRNAVHDARFALVQPGFARIDLVGSGEAARLVATLIAIPTASISIGGPEVVARWSVGLAGDVREEARE